jgi:hypothetical protein
VSGKGEAPDDTVWQRTAKPVADFGVVLSLTLVLVFEVLIFEAAALSSVDALLTIPKTEGVMD